MHSSLLLCLECCLASMTYTSLAVLATPLSVYIVCRTMPSLNRLQVPKHTFLQKLVTGMVQPGLITISPAQFSRCMHAQHTAVGAVQDCQLKL